MNEAIQQEIIKRTKKGWRVISQSDESAAMVKPKKFSVGWAIVGLGIFYCLYYWTKKEKIIYLSIADGRVQVTKG